MRCELNLLGRPYRAGWVNEADSLTVPDLQRRRLLRQLHSQPRVFLHARVQALARTQRHRPEQGTQPVRSEPPEVRRRTFLPSTANSAARRGLPLWDCPAAAAPPNWAPP